MLERFLSVVSTLILDVQTLFYRESPPGNVR